MEWYYDIHGERRPEPSVFESRCAACGMPTFLAEYHPFIACRLFESEHNGNSVRANLYAVVGFGSTADVPQAPQSGDGEG